MASNVHTGDTATGSTTTDHGGTSAASGQMRPAPGLGTEHTTFLIELRDNSGRGYQFTDTLLPQAEVLHRHYITPFVAVLNKDEFDAAWTILVDKAAEHVKQCLEGGYTDSTYQRSKPVIRTTGRCYSWIPGHDKHGALVVKRSEWPLQSREIIHRRAAIVLECAAIEPGPRDRERTIFTSSG